jgi:hypothetical protein
MASSKELIRNIQKGGKPFWSTTYPFTKKMANQLLVCITNDFFNVMQNIEPIDFNTYKSFTINDYFTIQF